MWSSRASVVGAQVPPGARPQWRPDGCLTLCTVLSLQPSPIKKERSPRPQSFCHSSSISPQDKLAQPGFGTPRDKQRLSYSAFTNQIFTSTSTDSPTSPTSEAPPLPPRNAGKGTGFEKGPVAPSSELGVTQSGGRIARCTWVAESGVGCQHQQR